MLENWFVEPSRFNEISIKKFMKFAEGVLDTPEIYLTDMSI